MLGYLIYSSVEFFSEIVQILYLLKLTRERPNEFECEACEQACWFNS